MVVIGGILSIVGGVVLVMARAEVDNYALWAGIAWTVFGLIYLAVARGLSNGNNGSRILVAIVSVLNITAGLWVALTQTGTAGVSGWSSVFWPVVILVVLYTPKANAFFASRS